MQKTSLIYVFNTEGQILLCAKKKTNSGFTISLGKRNGAGGKLEEGETVIQIVVRELYEETSIELTEEDFKLQGINTIYYEGNPERNQEVHIYVTKEYSGEFQESEELYPQWFNLEDIPYEKMRSDDIHRMPRMIAGHYFEYIFHFGADGMITNYQQIK